MAGNTPYTGKSVGALLTVGGWHSSGLAALRH